MPTQKFAPMTKNFATFDCDAHVTEPPWLWERAKDWLTSAEVEALKDTTWLDDESKPLIVNGFAGACRGSRRIRGKPRRISGLRLASAGMTHEIQRAMSAR